MIPLTSTYRLQMRGGVTFDVARAFLPHLADLGISHLYLSPIFTAQDGSTHGYDVTDANEIDPALGGEAGFRRLAEEAQAAGLGIVIDIVPNHMAFSLETPWLRDVLRHGQSSVYAGHFDIDWSEKLVLPFLEESFAEALAAGKVGVGRAEDGPVMTVGEGLAIPLAPGTTTADLDAMHAAQAWQLTRWERERDSITHRRFFNVTGLIGMRVEDETVFEDMHAKVFELVDAGLVQALRLDHIDGLADPGGYLERLKARVSVPIWVEKILTGDEELPDWGLAGTTGYEAARKIAQVLTDAKGQARIVEAWRAATGIEGAFHDAVSTAKNEVLRQDLAAELHGMIDLASAACEADARAQGAEALREAVIALLVAFPRYRPYFAAGTARDEDRALMADVADDAAEELRDRKVLDQLAGFITDPGTPAARAFQVRFQQVTGALLAKSHEDTAGFRWNAYLAANEVGADPDAPTVTPAELQDWLSRRGPLAMTLTSTHDTKRSEDARARLVAISHLPDDFADLVAAVDALDGATEASANDRWYLTQAALAIWGEPDFETRLRDHMIKALREAKVITNWVYPDEDAEAKVLDLIPGLAAGWGGEGLDRLVARGEVLSLIQVALKLAMPGVPDIYRGCEGPHFALTDPDNRLPVDLESLRGLPQAEGFAGQKARLTQTLLRLRRAEPAFFETAETRIEATDTGFALTRTAEGRHLRVTCDPSGAGQGAGSLVPEALPGLRIDFG
ncbi:malto-oligosyltrehalose synthase [Salipiger sp. IMCC34102]|nr:malto-oligosyltrehalose synthase [Salipiger sp. IMCC34102]